MGGKYCFWEKVIKYNLASRWGVPPGGHQGGVFSLRFVFGSFSKLILKVQFEELNLVVLFCCLSCFSTEYSGVENDNETEPVPVASAGCWIFLPTVHDCVSLTRNINSFHILHEVAVAELHFGPRHYLSCWFASCPPIPPTRIASWGPLLRPFCFQLK